MNNNRKNYIQINNHTISDQTFLLLDNVESDKEDDMRQSMNNSDTEVFVNDEVIETLFPILCQIYLCTGIVTILLATMVSKTFLQGIGTRRSYRIFTLQTILNKIKPTKARRYGLSVIIWTNHSKKALLMRLSKALMSILPSARDVPQ